MDKYQEKAKKMKDEELLAMADGVGGKILTVCIWIGGLGTALGILLISVMEEFLLFAILGILLLAMCVPLHNNYKKTKPAVDAEIIARGIEYKVRALERKTAEKRAENKAFGTFLLIAFILVALIIFGIRGCMGMGTVSCPKCGSTYSTDHPAGEYIESHGVCARCD